MNSDNQAYYDDFASGYEDERGRGYHQLIDDLELDVLRPLVRDREVLELGCGTGLILQHVKPLARQAHGIDLSPGMIATARTRGLDVSVASVYELPFADGTFDLLYSFKVLAHIPDLPRALAEAARVTKPGGKVVIELYNPMSLRYLAKRIAGPQPISDGRTEADVFTKWHAPWQVQENLPDTLKVSQVAGVRVFTPAAFFHRLPVVAPILRAGERAALRSPLRWFGGFLVVVLDRV
jgi:ubiquinone/menaquinone biosynthesis C-methylase UbiE